MALTVPYGEILSDIFCVRPSTQKDFKSFPRIISVCPTPKAASTKTPNQSAVLEILAHHMGTSRDSTDLRLLLSPQVQSHSSALVYQCCVLASSISTKEPNNHCVVTIATTFQFRSIAYRHKQINQPEVKLFPPLLRLAVPPSPDADGFAPVPGSSPPTPFALSLLLLPGGLLLPRAGGVPHDTDKLFLVLPDIGAHLAERCQRQRLSSWRGTAGGGSSCTRSPNSKAIQSADWKGSLDSWACG